MSRVLFWVGILELQYIIYSFRTLKEKTRHWCFIQNLSVLTFFQFVTVTIMQKCDKANLFQFVSPLQKMDPTLPDLLDKFIS